jgi:hypothetical protein
MPPLKLVRSRRGRPQKFGRPARAVTLTLPEDVIEALSTIDGDLSRAMVRLVQPLLANSGLRPSAELAKYGDNAVILIRPLTALQRMQGVKLVPLPDGRALISLTDSVSVYEFELRLRDAIEEEDLKPDEQSVLRSIGEILRGARLTRGVTVHQPNIIMLQSARRQRIG